MPDTCPAPFQVYHAWYATNFKDLPIYDHEKKSRPKPLWRLHIEARLQPFVGVFHIAIIFLNMISIVILSGQTGGSSCP
jgi:hypothetical protein